MLNRQNFLFLCDYLDERRNAVCVGSVRLSKTHLIKFLEFVGTMPLTHISKSLIGYKFSLLEGNRYSPEYIRKNLAETRSFLHWLRDEKGFHATGTWINRNFSVSARERNLSVTPPREYFTLVDVLKIVNTPVSNLREERIRAAAAFLFLSGARINAFLTLPIHAINISERTVNQWPSIGVKTKLGKSATTKLIRFPQHLILIETITAWDQKVRSALPDSAMWFPNINGLTGGFDTDFTVGSNRSSGFRQDLQQFLEKCGVSYKSPHQFRHGIIRYVRNFAKTARDLEAIAYNFMQTTATMLGYGKLSPTEAGDIIDGICSSTSEKPEISNMQSFLDSKIARSFYEAMKNHFEEQDNLF